MPRPSLPPIDPSTPPELVCACRKRLRPQPGAPCEHCASKYKRQADKRREGRQEAKVARKSSGLDEYPVFSTKVDLLTAAMSLLRAHHASPKASIHAAGHADEPSDEVINMRGSFQSPVTVQAAWSVPPEERPLNFGDAVKFLQRLGPTLAGVATDSPYRFTYRDICHSTDIPDTSTNYDCVARFICCQSLQSKHQRREQETNPSKKARLGRTCMRRFDCQGEMILRYDFALNALKLYIKHCIPHVAYQSVTFPDEALTIVERLVADGTVEITPIMQRITLNFPHLTWISRAQVRNVVRETLSSHYLLDKEPIQSLRAGLAQAAENGSVGLIDIDVPGVTAIAWAVLPILAEIKRRHLTVEEAFMDATFGTNTSNLELYVIMLDVEHGVPGYFMFLDTKVAIQDNARMAALSALLKTIHERYSFSPRIFHTDKDFAEIGAIQKSLPGSRPFLCWWHVLDAIITRLSKKSLETRGYDPLEARQYLPGIDPHFLSVLHASPSSSYFSREARATPPTQRSGTSSTHPHPLEPPIYLTNVFFPSKANAADLAAIMKLEKVDCDSKATKQQLIQLFDTHIRPRRQQWLQERYGISQVFTEERFCSPELQENILHLFNQAFHAHPSILGPWGLSAESIYQWAGYEFYTLCTKHEAPTLWAYLYVNWLAPDRWVLWARSSFEDCMPLRNTNMIAESFFANLKSESFLGKTRARLDELGHMLNTSVVPQYLQKVTTVGLQLGGRPRVSVLASWRKDLQTMLLAYGRMNIRPCNDVWIQNPASGTCNCPAFLKSPHFFCKHIYKMYSLNGAQWEKFLYDSVRLRHPPFWKSPSLPQPSQEFFHPPSSSSTTAYESEDEEEFLEQLVDGWMDGASLSDTDTRRAGAQATQGAAGAAGALGVAEAGTSVLDSIAEAEMMRRESGEMGEKMLRDVEALFKRMRIQVAQNDPRHVMELWDAIGARTDELITDMVKQERAVTSNARDTNTQREKRRGKGRKNLKFYDAMKAVASMKNGEPGSSADVN